MNRLIFYGLLCFQGIFANNENIDKYLEYISKYSIAQRANYKNNELQIIDNFNDICKAQDKYYNEFLIKGYLPEDAKKYSRLGVVIEDKYWIWFRDPIILPNGNTTGYNRFCPKNALDGPAGVSVLYISNNKILINIIFRHATRCWEIELPRGGRKKNETSKEAAIRELEEETGIIANKASKIASIASDSGILVNILDIILINEISQKNETNRKDCEAIHSCIFLSKEELKQAFVNGYIEMPINGKTTKVFCRDSFLASSLLIAETKGIL